MQSFQSRSRRKIVCAALLFGVLSMAGSAHALSLPPVIDSALVDAAITGVSHSYQITALNAPTSYSASGLPGGLSVDTSSGAISGTPTTAGIFNVAIGASNGTGSDSKTLVLTVVKGFPVVTWNNPAAVVFGVPLGGAQLNATANMPGTFTYAPPAGTMLSVGLGQALAVVFTPDDLNNYNPTTAGVSIGVLPATLTVTADNQSKVYGNANPPLTASISGFVNGDTASILTTPVSLATTADINSTAGSYPITALGASAPGYNINYVPATLTVTAATPVISTTPSVNIVYGTPLGAGQLNATSNIPGTFVYTPPSGTILNAGTGQTLSVAFTPTDIVDYTPATATVTINVLKQTPVVTWNPADVTFGSPLGAAQLDATANVPGTFVYTPAAGVSLLAGTQTLAVQFVPTDLANYNTVTATANVNVLQQSPTITWSPADMTFGSTLGAAQLNAIADVPGTFVYTPALGTSLNAGAQTLSVQFVPTDIVNYSVATVNATVNVLKQAPVITWNPAQVTFGSPLGAGQLDATANVPGTFVYTPPVGTVLPVGNQTLSVQFVPDDVANYGVAVSTVNVNVGQQAPVVTWNPAQIVYGSPLGAGQLDATANVPGTFVYTPAAGTMLNAGNQTLSAQFIPDDAVNYSAVLSSVNVNVGQQAPIVTWSPAQIVSGSPLGAGQLNATANVPGTFVYTPAAGTVLSAGNQTLSVQFTPDDAANFSTASSNVNINVGKQTPTITWNPAQVVYGSALGAGQLDATASVPGTFVYTPVAGTLLNAGNQTLSVQFTPDDAANYSAVSSSVNVNVGQQAPIISWNPAQLVYGSLLGAGQLDATANVPGTFVYTPAAGTMLNAGNQTLSVQFIPTDAANFSAVSSNVNINVGKQTPVITWNPAGLVFGTPVGNAQLNATVNVPGTFTYSPAAGAGLNAGTQTLSVQFTPDDAANYGPASKNVDINVGKQSPIIIWNPQGVSFGTPLGNNQLNATANVPGSFVYSPAGGSILNPGTQTLSAQFTPDDSINFNSVNCSVAIDVLAPPTIDSGPTANPNSALAGQFISFGCAASEDGQALTYSWNFGDGTSGSGNSVNHGYVTPGIYIVIVTVQDANGLSVSKSLAVTVNAVGTVAGDPNAPGANSGGPGNNDGSNLDDPIPFGTQTPNAIQPLIVKKMKTKLKFAREGRDVILISGTLPVPAGFKLQGQRFLVYVGGVLKSFVLNKNGRAKTGTDTVAVQIHRHRVGKKAKQKNFVAVYKVRLRRGDFDVQLSDEGLTGDATVKHVAVNVEVDVLFNNTLFQKVVTETYSAKEDKKGNSKYILKK